MPLVDCGSLGLRHARSSASQFLLIIIVFLAALALSGCGGNAPQNGAANPEKIASDSSECQVVKHALGETEICEQPQRVVALDPHTLDLLLSLDLQPIGYAETRYVASENLGGSIKQVPYLGKYLESSLTHVGTRQQPSLETILRLNPDLILKNYGADQSLYTRLSQIAPTLLFRDGSNNYQWQQGIRTIAQVTNREQRAQQVIKQHNQRIARARSELKSLTRGSEILLLAMSGLDRIEVFTGETFAGDLLRNLGFKLVTPEGIQANSREIPISLETLPQLHADRMIVMASGNSRVKQIEKVWQQNPILRSQPAFQAGQVYFVDYQLWSRIRGPIATKLIIKQIRSLFLEPN